MPTAVIFPADPEANVFDLVDQARAAFKRGLRLYTNGRQLALLPRPAQGWHLFAAGAHSIHQAEPQCAA